MSIGPFFDRAHARIPFARRIFSTAQLFVIVVFFAARSVETRVNSDNDDEHVDRISANLRNASI